MVISEASLATAVPSPIDRPTSATFRAGASFVPSPVAATTSPRFWRSRTNRSLSFGRARDRIFTSSTRLINSSSVIAANSVPVSMFLSVSFSFQRPICLPISFAVPDVSPVTILTCMPALTQSLIAAGTSSRTGSEIAKIPTKFRFFAFSFPSLRTSSLSLLSTYAKASVRIALF